MPQLTPNSLYNTGSPSPTMPSSSVTSGATPKKSWGLTADAAMIGASMAMPSMLAMLQKTHIECRRQTWICQMLEVLE